MGNTSLLPASTSLTSNGHETRWAPVVGLWEFAGTSAKYLGPSSNESLQPYGIALTNQNITDGSVGVRIKFSQVNPEGKVSGGIILGFQSERSRYVIVQLGAWGRAYSIGEYVPGITWQAIEAVGSAKNLEPNKEYDVDVRQTGQEGR